VRAFTWLVIAGVVLCARPTAADSDEETARTHFGAGKRFYEAGQYRDALREWTAANEASPRRAFLVNLGQVYRKLDDLPKAREMFLRFLAEALPDEGHACRTQADCNADLRCQEPAPAAATVCVDPLRSQVEALIAAIDGAEPARDRSRPAAGEAAIPMPAVAARSVEARQDLEITRPPLAARSTWHWWVGAGIAVVAAGVAVVWLARSDRIACSTAPLGCIDRR
jgi:tetratricopeptide (TPR) repeat protein